MTFHLVFLQTPKIPTVTIFKISIRIGYFYSLDQHGFLKIIVRFIVEKLDAKSFRTAGIHMDEMGYSFFDIYTIPLHPLNIVQSQVLFGGPIFQSSSTPHVFTLNFVFSCPLLCKWSCLFQYHYKGEIASINFSLLTLFHHSFKIHLSFSSTSQLHLSHISFVLSLCLLKMSLPIIAFSSVSPIICNSPVHSWC